MTEKHYPNATYLRVMARTAGEIMLKNFHLGMAREWKADGTPLTAADKEINELVVRSLEKDFPHIHVVGEEGSREVKDAEYTVLCDPVDGTIPFSMGIPISTFCISVLKAGVPVAAVIHDPFQNRTWHATQGGGCWLNEDRVVIKPRNHEVNQAQICMVWWHDSQYNLHQVCAKIMAAGGKWMNPSSIAYFGGLVASGEVGATIFPGQQGWETAAMQLLVEEAGGKSSDIRGWPLRYGPNGEINGHIISNSLALHRELVEIVRSCQ